MATGEYNAITDVPGVLVGQYERTEDGWLCGATVVLPPEGTVGAVDQRAGLGDTRDGPTAAGEPGEHGGRRVSGGW